MKVRMLAILAVLGLGVGFGYFAWAEAETVTPVTEEGTDMISAESSEVQSPQANIERNIKQVFPEMTVQAVFPTPMAGMYEVHLETNKNTAFSVYMSADGQYFFDGDMMQVVGDSLHNLADSTRARIFAELDSAQMVQFIPEGKVKGQVYVFTDIDCGYCRKLHQEVPTLQALGIQVNYLAFPRAGLGSSSAAKLDSVWCANDRQDAMNRSKRGEKLPPADSLCKSPVAEEYKLGTLVGVGGTPAVYTAEGKKIGGYMSATELAQDLGL